MRQISDLPITTRVVADAQAAAREVAAEIAREIGHKPSLVLGCATGRTPRATYAELVRLAQEGLSCRQLRTFNLDEYHGLDAHNTASFESFMQRQLFQPAGINSELTLFPRCMTLGEDPLAAASHFEAQITNAGGIDLQLLGIGGNGHIAFNEPGSKRESRTRLVKLAESTRLANARDFPEGESVPTHAMTMGIETIFEARKLRVLAFGAHKAEIIRRVLHEPVTDELPASFLREHADVVLWLDEEAAENL
ncbi:MAG: glucosamine-6-phosphate deaminase [Planctomycetota bacterium]|jgi:glucosamine-6-phosphate deaminase